MPKPSPDSNNTESGAGGVAPRVGSDLLTRALTHRSAATTPAESNERLEFLGDALLSVFVARYLYDTMPPDTEEGILTRTRIEVVRKETLAKAARTLQLHERLLIGPGERKEGRQERDSLLADAFEALVAAIYLEQGEAAMETFLHNSLGDILQTLVATPPENDPKTTLQIRLQSEGRGLPTYVTTHEEGHSGKWIFIVEVRSADNSVLGTGTGSSKRAAQTNAAREALLQIANH